MLKFLAQSLAFVLFVALAPAASAQSQPAPAPASAPAQGDLLKPEEIDALLSPIALYPDNLLAQVMMASTYPLEVVQASRWLKENKGLKDDALKAAVDKQGWDESVRSLVATPSVLDMMSDKLDWTQKLGDAVLAQQADVMDGVQRLRAKADANKKLTSTKEQKVSKKSEGSKQVIVIEPTNPQTVYVPYYDPAVVYGAWPYPAYPPYYWGAGYWPGGGALLATGLAFGAGYAIGRWAGGGGYWGGNVNWTNNNINVNRPGGGGGNWQHNVDHRHGVRYNNKDVANRFDKGNNIRGGANNRMDFRGHNGQAALRPGGPGGDRPGGGAGAGNRPGGGDRPGGGGAGNRPGGGGGGQKAATRPAGGGKPSAGTRPAGGGGHNAFAGSGGGGRAAAASASRGHTSMSARGGGGGGGARAGGGGGGRGGGGGGGRGGGGGGGGGRRSDVALKHDISLLGHLDNGLGFYRFSYNGSDKAYVGVMAQEVQVVAPDAVMRGHDGYLRVFYDKLGLQFQTYDQWLATGARIPSVAPQPH